MGTNTENCPLCGEPAASERVSDTGNAKFRCDTCGNFEITLQAQDMIRQAARETPDLFPCLSAATRLATERGERIVIKSGNLRELAQQHAGLSPTAKLRLLLEYLHGKSGFFGAPVPFNPNKDWPLIRAAKRDECNAIVHHAFSSDLAKRVGDDMKYTLTWNGWQNVDPIGGGTPGLAFVAMAFSPDLAKAFEDGIQPGVADCGFQSIRVDKEAFSEKICDRIIADIRRAQFVIADFTHQRNGVYFEAGYALALGRPVIWTCREDDVDNLHFDTRQYPHILWTEPADLRTQLRNRIRALIPGARLA